MKRRKLVIVVLAALAVLAIGSSADAIRLRAGNIIITADGGFSPTKLPRHENAPITIHGGGKISTVNGELPPILETIDIEFDRHGAVDTVGLPICRAGQLEATTVEQARAACPGAIVGKGRGKAIVKFPEQAPIPASSPITIFNGPKKHGNPTVLAHAYLDHPVPTTFIVPVEIEKIHKGIYGYRTHGEDPENRRRRRRPDRRRTDDRQKMDLQGQEALLHRRPLRNRAASGPRPVPLQRRHLPVGDVPAPLPGARIAPSAGCAQPVRSSG